MDEQPTGVTPVDPSIPTNVPIDPAVAGADITGQTQPGTGAVAPATDQPQVVVTPSGDYIDPEISSANAAPEQMDSVAAEAAAAAAAEQASPPAATPTAPPAPSVPPAPAPTPPEPWTPDGPTNQPPAA